ncbi:MAG: DNA-directed RNA polymerase [Candidatus Heimdallarchaeota archaeon]|nr:DNA-directed RNA polymerase [Candidatus Heimdallarchaeota archaeon]
MYYVAEVRDTIRVEPKRFGENLEEVVLEICRETFEGSVTRDLGLTIVVVDILDIGPGRLVPGDGAAFYDVAFTTLNYLPENKEFVKGEVVEVTDFGVFLRLGCVDALCHVSQVSDDFYSYSSKQGALLGRESGRSITVGDKVRARIIAVTIGKSNIRVGVTMRQPGLGLEDWVEKWREKHEQPEKAKKKKEEEKKKPKPKKKEEEKKKPKPKKKEEKPKPKKKEEEKKPIEITYKKRTYTFEPDISLDELQSKRGVPIKVKEKVAKERGFEDYGK